MRPRWGIIVLGLCQMATFAVGTEVRPPLFGELVNEADYVVQARVVGIESRLEQHRAREIIVTYTDLEIIDTIAGKPPAQIRLRQLGGKVGDRQLRVDGAPPMFVGMEAIFFVQGNGRQYFPLVALMHGLYPITRPDAEQDAIVLRSNGEPLRHTSEVSHAMHGTHSESAEQETEFTGPALTVEAFKESILRTRKREKGQAQDD